MNYHLSLFTWRGVQKAACLGWAIWGQRQWLVLMLIARMAACEIYQMSPIALALCCMTAYNSMTKEMLTNINISPSIVGKKNDPGMLHRMYKSSHFWGHPYFIQDSPKTRLQKTPLNSAEITVFTVGFLQTACWRLWGHHWHGGSVGWCHVGCKMGARNTPVVAGGVSDRLAGGLIDSMLPFVNFCKNI